MSRCAQTVVFQIVFCIGKSAVTFYPDAPKCCEIIGLSGDFFEMEGRIPVGLFYCGSWPAEGSAARRRKQVGRPKTQNMGSGDGTAGRRQLAVAHVEQFRSLNVALSQSINVLTLHSILLSTTQ